MRSLAETGNFGISLHSGAGRARSPANARRHARLAALSTALMATLLLGLSPLKIGVVVGDSMLPTLKPNQTFLLDRSCYKRRAPARDDIIVFRLDGEACVKRVAAGPGESLWLLEYSGPPPAAPDREIVHPHELHRLRELLGRHPGVGRLRRVTVPEGYVFVVGDAADVSLDSRQLGPISIDQVVGRVLVQRTEVPHHGEQTCVRMASRSIR